MSQLYLSLDSALQFRLLYEHQEPSLNALAVLSEWSDINGLSLTAREDFMSTFMLQMKRFKEELNLKINAQLTTDLDVARTAFELQPDRVTLLPSRWVGASVVGGLDVYHIQDQLRTQIMQLHEADIEVAVQVEPKTNLIKRLQRLDADVVILSTHALMSSGRGEARRTQFREVMDVAVLAARLGLKVGVSGGIDLTACEQLSRIKQVSEIHVGESILGRAMMRGLEQSIQDFLKAIQRGRQNLL